MNGYCYFILGILILAAGYFTYGRVLEKIFRPDASRQTPAVACTDGVDYVVMPRWRVFLIQLLNIAGLGPIFGAVMGVLYGPAKAANAGGVAVSGLEMSQNSYRLSWTFEEVDAKLKSIMEEIVANSLAAAKEYGHEGDLMLGANAAGFVKVANAMVAQGVL